MGLTSEDMAELQTALLQKRCEILSSVTGIEESLRRNEATETGDCDVENTVCLLENEQKIVTEIDHCLWAMAEGLYGICSSCGSHIPSERLKAIPWTNRCVACAVAAEHPRAFIRWCIKKRQPADR